jgi:hypothetical protein
MGPSAPWPCPFRQGVPPAGGPHYHVRGGYYHPVPCHGAAKLSNLVTGTASSLCPSPPSTSPRSALGRRAAPLWGCRAMPCAVSLRLTQVCRGQNKYIKHFLNRHLLVLQISQESKMNFSALQHTRHYFPAGLSVGQGKHAQNKMRRYFNPLSQDGWSFKILGATQYADHPHVHYCRNLIVDYCKQTSMLGL